MLNKEVTGINGYINYGDCNLEHGIILVKKDTSCNDCYYVLKTQYNHDDNNYQLLDLYVDISYSWINWIKVQSCCDTDLTNIIHKVIDLVHYYNYLEFGNIKICHSLQELRNKLVNEYDAIEYLEL